MNLDLKWLTKCTKPGKLCPWTACSPFLLLVTLFLSIPNHLPAWSSNPAENQPVVTVGGSKTHKMVSDGHGGIIFAWRDDGIWIQRLNKHGKAMWPTSGIRITQHDLNPISFELISDGNGGAIIALHHITWYYFSPTGDTRVYRIDAEGNRLWVRSFDSASSLSGVFYEIVPDGDGGVIMARTRHSDNRVRAYRISAEGNMLWPSTGVLVDLPENTDNRWFVQAVSDGAGGAMCTWFEATGPGINHPFAIYARRINSAGAPQGMGPTTLLASGLATWPGTGTGTNLISDGAGGAILSWVDSRAKVYTQRINHADVTQWTANGLLIAPDGGEQWTPKATPDGTGGAVIVWYDDRPVAPGIYAQRVSGAGTALWGSGGIAVSTGAPSNQIPSIAVLPDNEFVVTWSQELNGSGLDIVAQKLNANGEFQWGPDGIAVSTAANNQSSPLVQGEVDGQATFSWLDARSGTLRDIYAARLTNEGNQVNSRADLSVEKSVVEPVTTQGETLRYDITISNAGPNVSFETQAIDPLPAGCSFTSATTSQGNYHYQDGTVLFDVGTLNVSETVYISIHALAVSTGTLENTATVVGDVPDPDNTNNSATVASTIIEPEYGPCPDTQVVFLEPVAVKCKESRKGLRCKVKAKALVSNIGQERSASTVVCFYLSDDAEFDPNVDVPLKQKKVKALKPGKTKKVNLTTKLELGTDASGQYIIAVIGCDEPMISPCEEDKRMAVSGAM